MEETAVGLQIESLTIRRGAKVLLDDVSLSIAPGSLVALIGPSGSGKSTFLRTIGLRPPSKRHHDHGIVSYFFEGSDEAVRVSGRNHQALLNLLSYVPQEDLLPENARVREVVEEALIFANSQTKSEDLLTSVNLPARLWSRTVDQLSGGERRRLTLARALCSDPRILLLDEPTSGLDYPVALEVMALLRQLCDERGLTIISTSHLPKSLTSCDRLLIMNEGGQFKADLLEPKKVLESVDEKDLFQLRQDSPAPPKLAYRSTEAAEGHSWNFSHFKAMFRRSWRQQTRDLSSFAVTLLLPLALAFVIIASQALHGKNAPTFVNFFLSIAALWIGMSLTVREIVSSRSLYAIDELSGLGKFSYFAAKATSATGFCLTSVFILCTSAWGFIHLFGIDADAVADSAWFDARDFISHLIVLSMVSVSGAMIGFLISTFARSERGAVSLMPLVLLPHVLFSKYATGSANLGEGDELGHPFHSLNLTHFHLEAFNSLELANFWTGLLMSTRHAAAIFDDLGSGLFPFSAIFGADFWALIGLTTIQASLALLFFCFTANSSLHRIK